jgi:hypothetical protein
MKRLVLYLIWSFTQLKRYVKYHYNQLMHPISIKEIKNQIATDALFFNMDAQEKRVWEIRINDVVNSPDNQFIPRVKNAGSFEGDYLIMHNGLKIDPVSYYGNSILKMLIENKGVHEPQEERVFATVLKTIPENAVMIELGSYWAFYSMWFYRSVPNAKCYMIEPELSNLEFGKKNFRINGMKGSFHHGYVSDKSLLSKKGDRYIGVDDFVKEQHIDFVDVLHSDIQGYELHMLKGAKVLFDSKKVGYVFISTHSNAIHKDCIAFLKSYQFTIIAEADLDETFSVDGLIAAKAPYYKGVEKVEISKKVIEIN